jgi:hypothetical protein
MKTIYIYIYYLLMFYTLIREETSLCVVTGVSYIPTTIDYSNSAILRLARKIKRLLTLNVEALR